MFAASLMGTAMFIAAPAMAQPQSKRIKSVAS
jgi:hypothetical protein